MPLQVMQRMLPTQPVPLQLKHFIVAPAMSVAARPMATTAIVNAFMHVLSLKKIPHRIMSNCMALAGAPTVRRRVTSCPHEGTASGRLAAGLRSAGVRAL